jgi:NTE family protein
MGRSGPGGGDSGGMRSDRCALAVFTCLVLVLTGFVLAGCAVFHRSHPAPPAPAGREVRPKIGIALGGGGARGFAHIGALRVLEQEKIPVDVVVGTSVGSLVGALYADQGRVLDAEFNALQVETTDLFDYRALSIFSGGLIKGDRLEKFVREQVKSARIEQMAIPYAAVAVDMKSGATVIFDHGPVAPAVHASCAIPGVFQPVVIDGVSYVDGGLTDPVPSDVARSLGADVVIAMAIPAPTAEKNVPKNPIAVIHRAISIMASEIGLLRSKEADVVIKAEVGKIDYDDFSQKKEIIEAGEAAARAALPAIRSAIAARTKVLP